MKKVDRPVEYRIYKPYKQSDGAASGFQMKITHDPEAKWNKRSVDLFWVATNQVGINPETKNPKFGWDDNSKSATMKLGLMDVGELLLILQGKKEEVTLYHQNRQGNTIVKLKKAQTKSGPVLNFQMSSKRGEALVKVAHNISQAEAQILIQLLKDFISSYHSWGQLQVF
tara:strand:- start:118 stop:627 length:510 start_codon:yes stop_codon:yes gene_type:complete